jgi:threonine dehydratase
MKINLKDLQRARQNLSSIIKKTELISSDYFSKISKNKVYLKPENLQTTGSYKIRGAYNKIFSLNDKERKRGLIAASAGNHAQGVAYAAKLLKIKTTIVMPTTTPLIKVDRTRELGAKVILFGLCYDDAYKEARRLSKSNNLVFIHPFNDQEVITGQGTIALEILDELPNTEVIIVPVGGGGLISGIAIAAKLINPSIKIIGVEPKGADAMKRSLEAKKIIHLEATNTIADGVAVKEVGDLTFKLVKDYVDKIVTVSESEIMEAFLMLIEKHKIVVEPAGALSIAVFFNGKLRLKNKSIVCLLSGGNIDLSTISGLVNRGLIKLGRVFDFSIELFDRPGELLNLAKIINRHNANIIKIVHDQFKHIDRFKKVKVTITLETEGHKHIKKIISALKKEGYNVYYTS